MKKNMKERLNDALTCAMYGALGVLGAIAILEALCTA